jgi:hypothetical protein
MALWENSSCVFGDCIHRRYFEGKGAHIIAHSSSFCRHKGCYSTILAVLIFLQVVLKTCLCRALEIVSAFGWTETVRHRHTYRRPLVFDQTEKDISDVDLGF